MCTVVSSLILVLELHGVGYCESSVVLPTGKNDSVGAEQGYGEALGIYRELA